MSRLELLWSNLRSSFWFVPSLIFAASIALALGLIELDSGDVRPWLERWPRVFGSGAGGARGVLSTIAGSMMTVVGVTFSMTLVTLALASSQYTSRILRNFMGDRITQVALGIFGGIYIYCLLVLRTIRGGDEEYVPSLAVLFGVVLAVGGIAILIFFIHHIATAIQASSIIESVANETLSSIDRQFPKRVAGGELAGVQAAPGPETASGTCSAVVTSKRVGYIQSINVSALAAIAHSGEAVVHIARSVGEFVVRDAVLASVDSPGPLPDGFIRDAESAFNIHRFRTVEQDVGFGIRQIVDIALRALSPSANDTTTGVLCVDYLSAILAHLANRPFPAREHRCEGRLRVVTAEMDFAQILSGAFDQIRGNARDNLAVLARILAALRAVAVATQDRQRRLALADYLVCMREFSGGLRSAHERAQYDDMLKDTQQALLREQA